MLQAVPLRYQERKLRAHGARRIRAQGPRLAASPTVIPDQKQKQKYETELTASVLKKRSKVHKRLKRTLLYLDETGQNVQIFEEVLFFQATYNIKTEKRTINSLRLCQFDAGMLADGKGNKTDILS